MSYTAKDFSFLLGMKGFSETLLKNHFTLYQGYVANTNKVMGLFGQPAESRQGGDPGICRTEAAPGMGIQRHAPPRTLFREPGRRRQPGSGPGTDQAGDGPIRLGGRLRQRLHGHRQHARHRLGGLLRRDSKADCSSITWVNEHDVGHLTGCNPVLICDVFEHAFMIDYGLKKADYLT